MSIIPGLFPSPAEAMDIYNQGKKAAAAEKAYADQLHEENMAALDAALSGETFGQYHGNSRGELIPTSEYVPGSYGYGQDYTEAKGVIENWMDYVNNPGMTSPNRTVETVQDTVSNAVNAVTNIQVPEIKWPEFPTVNWPVVGLILVGGILLLVFASGVSRGVGEGVSKRIAK
jgi:hypothetical protein